MSKIAVVFWTGTGNTSTMATAVVEGIKEAGAEAELISAADFGAAKCGYYDPGYERNYKIYAGRYHYYGYQPSRCGYLPRKNQSQLSGE